MLCFEKLLANCVVFYGCEYDSHTSLQCVYSMLLLLLLSFFVFAFALAYYSHNTHSTTTHLCVFPAAVRFESGSRTLARTALTTGRTELAPAGRVFAGARERGRRGNSAIPHAFQGVWQARRVASCLRVAPYFASFGRHTALS